MMKKLFLLFAVLASSALMAQDYSWKSARIDGSRTGCITPSKDNVAEAIGHFEKGKYIAPGGKKYPKKSATAKTAAAVLAAQPAMARVKDVIAYSPKELSTRRPDSALSNWFVDIVMAKTAQLAGKPVHFGVTNFGGIRTNMPVGDVILDDMLSMFPFKNSLVYLEMKGSTIRGILENMAATHFQVVGGVRVVVENGKLVSAEIDGEPIDDEKVYGVATISFLLKGGDGITMEDGALTIQNFDVDIIDAVLEHVYAETAAGRPLAPEADGRVVIKK